MACALLGGDINCDHFPLLEDDDINPIDSYSISVMLLCQMIWA